MFWNPRLWVGSVILEGQKWSKWTSITSIALFRLKWKQISDIYLVSRVTISTQRTQSYKIFCELKWKKSITTSSLSTFNFPECMYGFMETSTHSKFGKHLRFLYNFPLTMSWLSAYAASSLFWYARTDSLTTSRLMFVKVDDKELSLSSINVDLWEPSMGIWLNCW